MIANRVRRSFYLDSVALMRLSQDAAALPGVAAAALMIGSASNKRLMADAGLLAPEGEGAGPNDLVVGLRAADAGSAEAALAAIGLWLDKPAGLRTGGAAAWRAKSLAAAADGANLALISVPGAFAAAEARKALRRGLHVMIFSDNVSVEDEIALKEEARARGLLVMGPDCGTAIVGGVPLAFANRVPRGDVGIVAASGTGLQEVSCLAARGGRGVSHAIGVGGRDLSERVGGIMTLVAIDALDADPATKHIVLVSKPPGSSVTAKIAERIGRSAKRFTVCFLGLDGLALPANARLAPTLRAAAADVLGAAMPGPDAAMLARAKNRSASLSPARRYVRGLFSGGTLCAEAQAIFVARRERVASNAAIPQAIGIAGAPTEDAHVCIDLGADEYTLGRPHPMIDPTVRNAEMAKALSDPSVAALLIDMVIGYGAHRDPAAQAAAVLAAAPSDAPPVVASVTGVEEDPQRLSAQVATLERAGIFVAPSNADAAALALDFARRFT